MYFKVIQPGYAIAKRRSGISVTLNMDELYAGASKVDKNNCCYDTDHHTFATCIEICRLQSM